MPNEEPVKTLPQAESPPPGGAAGEIQRNVLREKVVEILRTCYDPEIPVDIYDLGLIYSIDVDDVSMVRIRMTLTSPHCPAAESLPPDVLRKVKSVAGVADAKVDVVWEPTWTQEMMSDAAKLKLGFM